MVWKKKHWVLLVLIGVLLGLLGALVVLLGRAQAPSPRKESPLPQPAQASPAPEASPPPAGSPSPAPEEPVGEALVAFAGSHPGRWSLCWMALPGGSPVYVATDGEAMVSASLIKLFIMGAVYEQLESGALERDTAAPLLKAMITVSDNPSANELIRLLGGGDEEKGMSAVNDWCARQGYAETSLNRLMLVENGLQNTTTAADCAAMLAAIYRGDCVSRAASEEMLGLLLGQTRNDRLPAGLPEGTPIAHKTGELLGLCWADVGIVYSPGGDYILCVISDGALTEAEAREAMAALSRQIYEILNP